MSKKELQSKEVVKETFEEYRARVNKPISLSTFQKNRNIFWVQKNKNKYERVKIKDMTTSHIKSCRNIVIKNCNTIDDVFGGYTRAFWIELFDQEMAYRDKLGQRIINEIPKFKKTINKAIAKLSN